MPQPPSEPPTGFYASVEAAMDAINCDDEREQEDKRMSEHDELRWGKYASGYCETCPTVDKVPAGFYATMADPHRGLIICPRALHVDKLLPLPDGDTEAIIAEFEHFWTLKAEFTKRGFTHKRGFLLHGAPGSGKTACVQRIIHKVIHDYDGIVLNGNHAQVLAGCAQMVRRLEPERPIVIVLEDFDALVIKDHQEDTFLSLLDGEGQVGNCVYLATTNYPERLDKRFLNRPSRFDTVKFIGMPSAAAREAFLKAKDPALAADPVELRRWVKKSKGFSIAHLKELLIAVKCLNQDFDAVIERLETMHERLPTSDDQKERADIGILPFHKSTGAAARLTED
jgi:hypothetical protein